MERGLVNDAAVADSVEHRRAFWHLREILPEAQKGEGGSIKHDISVPVAAVPDFLHDAGEAVEALIPGSRLVPLDSANHLLPEQDPAWPRFLDELDSFLSTPAET